MILLIMVDDKIKLSFLQNLYFLNRAHCLQAIATGKKFDGRNKGFIDF